MNPESKRTIELKIPKLQQNSVKQLLTRNVRLREFDTFATH